MSHCDLDLDLTVSIIKLVRTIFIYGNIIAYIYVRLCLLFIDFLSDNGQEQKQTKKGQFCFQGGWCQSVKGQE